jgi:RecB family exonuclease
MPDHVESASDRALRAWRELTANPGIPQWLDVPVLVKPAPRRDERRKLVLHATTEDGRPLGYCTVYTNEWYPGCPNPNPFSHYFPVLAHVLEARARRGIATPLRLQVLRAVAAITASGWRQVVLIKFIVAPEYTVTGSLVEQLYQCPLQVFFERFLGLPRDFREREPQPSDIRGRAIHAGYRRALVTFASTGDRQMAAAEYRAAVWAEWTRTIQTLLAAKETKDGLPPKDLRLSFEAANSILDQVQRTLDPAAEPFELYLERLFYSPTRGLSGRADRVEVPLDPTASPLRIAEVKTRSFHAERDPLTGESVPGGLQALAYREVLQSVGFPSVDAVVELVDEKRLSAVPLEQHPLVRRLRLDLSRRDERLVDLIAQARNVFYCIASGLFTGYDRYRLHGATENWRLPKIIGQFDLLSEVPPCKPCVARSRRVCAQAREPDGKPLSGLFRYAPPALFSYWVWFHRQLKAEEHAERERFFHLTQTSAPFLEQEGITLSELRFRQQDGQRVTFERPGRRLDTRIREDDTVLITPQWPDGLRQRIPRPGELFSVEGTVVALGEYEITVELRDRVPLAPDGHDPLYRIDQLTGWDMRAWQLEGLADFFVTLDDRSISPGAEKSTGGNFRRSHRLSSVSARRAYPRPRRRFPAGSPADSTSRNAGHWPRHSRSSRVTSCSSRGHRVLAKRHSSPRSCVVSSPARCSIRHDPPAAVPSSSSPTRTGQPTRWYARCGRTYPKFSLSSSASAASARTWKRKLLPRHWSPAAGSPPACAASRRTTTKRRSNGCSPPAAGRARSASMLLSSSPRWVPPTQPSCAD